MYASTHADAPLSPEQRRAELAKLYRAIDLFTEEMVRHLERKVEAGWRGWDDPTNGREIWNSLLAHASGVPMAKGQEVGIANFAMFLWFHRFCAGQTIDAGLYQGTEPRHDTAHAVAPVAFVNDAGDVELEKELDPGTKLYIDQRGPAQIDVARINRMVDRFLAWPLPKDFSPDCGISFDGAGTDPEGYQDAAGYRRSWPIGTNLLTAEQAREMFQYVLADEGPQKPPAPRGVGEGDLGVE